MKPYLVMFDPLVSMVYGEILSALAHVDGYEQVCARVSVGLELDLSSSASAIEVPGTAATSKERPWLATAKSSRFTVLEDHRRRLVEAVARPSFSRARTGPVIREQGDLLVFSRMPVEVGEEFGNRLSELPYCWLAGHIDLSDRVVHRLAWGALSHFGVVANGVWLRSWSEGMIEDQSILERAVETGLVPTGVLPVEVIPGFRRNGTLLDFARSYLYPDESVKDVGLPLDASPPEFAAPVRRRLTAAEKALLAIGAESMAGAPAATFRGRALDDLSVPGHFSLPPIEDQIPDFALIYEKVVSYCLDPAQEKQKYNGFRRLGFQHTPQHARLLAHQLISAVLHRDVLVGEPSVNVHGELMFTVDSKVIGPLGKHAAVHSCWMQQAQGGLRLLTAWTTSAATSGTLSPTYDPPGDIATDDFESIVSEATRIAIEAGTEIGSAFGMAFGSLLIPCTVQTKRFRRWLRLQGSVQVTSRARLGGKCIVLSLNTGLVHHDQLAIAFANAAVVLGLFDIDAVPELTWN
jgi:hypothetical protein